MKIINCILIFLSCCSISGFAQNEKPIIRNGNKEYKKGDYAKAEITYRKSIEKNNKTTEGKFNLGDALYKQNKFDEAAGTFQNLTNEAMTDEMKARSFYNQGNAYLKAEKFEESANAYKNSLRLNPADEDARYNYTYALSKLRQQQQQNKDNKENKENKKDNKDNKDNKDKNKQDQKQDEKKKEDNKQDSSRQNEQQKEQTQQPKISKEDAERMLQALKNDERNLQKRLAKKEGSRIKIEKQW
jgi:tetratricopeptide (TPR) repeat protein